MAPVPCMTTSASQGQSLLVQACLKALPHTVPGQRVNCIPGISALTDKRRLIETLVRAYGEGAFRIVPRTFLLPDEYLEWRAWIRAHAVRLSP